MDTNPILTSDEVIKTLQSIHNVLERLSSQSPRLTRTKEINIAMDNFGQAFTTSVINANSNAVTGQLYYRTNEIINFSNAGANHLYRNIT